MNQRPQIAFLSSLNPMDQKSWSGIFYFMFQALQKHCGDVFWINPNDKSRVFFGKVIYKVSKMLTGKLYDYQHSVFLSKYYARVFDRCLQSKYFDIIFAPGGSTQIAHVRTSIPIVYTTDATFALVRDYYPDYSNLHRVSMREADGIERKALEKASLVLFPTAWAAQSACTDYGVSESKIHIVPYGANIQEVPRREVILNKKKSSRCRLLFLGVHWERKGGDIAFETLKELQRLGVDSELFVVGCEPPDRIRHHRLTVISSLNKNDAIDRQRFNQILLNSDFLLLPTRAEAFGIAFCEASAYGLPSIAANTGGVSGVVIDGENGVLLDPKLRGDSYARVIAEIFRDDERYYRLVRSSRLEYEQRLNWDTWGQRVDQLIRGLIIQKKTTRPS